LHIAKHTYGCKHVYGSSLEQHHKIEKNKKKKKKKKKTTNMVVCFGDHCIFSIFAGPNSDSNHNLKVVLASSK
jgi:hypothetical protein